MTNFHQFRWTRSASLSDVHSFVSKKLIDVVTVVIVFVVKVVVKVVGVSFLVGEMLRVRVTDVCCSATNQKGKNRFTTP